MHLLTLLEARLLEVCFIKTLLGKSHWKKLSEEKRVHTLPSQKVFTNNNYKKNPLIVLHKNPPVF